MAKTCLIMIISSALLSPSDSFALQPIYTRPTRQQSHVAPLPLSSRHALRRIHTQSTAIAGDFKDILLTSESQPLVKKPSDSALIVGLAFLSGWIDVTCIQLFGCYITMMTGPTINVISTGIGGSFTNMYYNAAVLASYCVGSMFYRVLENKRGGVKMARAIAPWLVVSFVGADFLALVDPTSKLSGLALALGYGLINCLSLGVTAVITCMLTAHIQRVAHAGVDAMMGKPMISGQKILLWRSTMVLVPFMLGAYLSIIGRASVLLTPFHLIRGFSIVGCAYAALLYYHDRPTTISYSNAA